jgi:hypothetical protein
MIGYTRYFMARTHTQQGLSVTVNFLDAPYMRTQPHQPILGGVTPLRKLRDLPGPRGWPLLGNSLQVDTQKLHLKPAR